MKCYAGTHRLSYRHRNAHVLRWQNPARARRPFLHPLTGMFLNDTVLDAMPGRGHPNRSVSNLLKIFVDL
jgi:hypothetical protein